tara:strand:+ start:97 stop:405 length:309 start_codon:yes stop_codon:yes gene_type:complete
MALLMATFITLQTTAPQNHIIYLAAPDGVTRVKPVDASTANQKVLTLEEAVARYEEKHGPIRVEPDDYNYDESDCLLGSCALESELFMVKWKVKSILRILVG